MVHGLLAAGHLAATHGQGLRQVGELLVAFALSTLIGLERQLRGKSAGLRTQAIVGTTSALFLQVSKYGFGDVLAPGHVVLDPSRVAAQVVTGIGFLGAGLILTRQGSVRGLTTAAAVWETAAIGMAAGAGLPLLAGVVTGLHYFAIVAFTPLARRLPGSRPVSVLLRLEYVDGRGALRGIIAAATASGWQVSDLRPGRPEEHPDGTRVVPVTVGLSGRARPHDLLVRLSEVEDVRDVSLVADDED